jgi:hypothetical protein
MPGWVIRVGACHVAIIIPYIHASIVHPDSSHLYLLQRLNQSNIRGPYMMIPLTSQSSMSRPSSMRCSVILHISCRNPYFNLFIFTPSFLCKSIYLWYACVKKAVLENVCVLIHCWSCDFSNPVLIFFRQMWDKLTTDSHQTIDVNLFAQRVANKAYNISNPGHFDSAPFEIIEKHNRYGNRYGMDIRAQHQGTHNYFMILFCTSNQTITSSSKLLWHNPNSHTWKQHSNTTKLIKTGVYC